MKKNSLDEDKKRVALIFFLTLVIALSFFLVYRFRSRSKSDGTIQKGQIQIIKGEDVITINENGLVEYKSKDRVYYETWGAEKISTFFSMMENKAREYLKNKSVGGDCGYKVYMFLGNKLVSFCIDSGDSEMQENVEPIFTKYTDNIFKDFFEEDFGQGETEEEKSESSYFPSPTSVIIKLSPTPSPAPLFYSGSNYPPVKAGCEAWSGEIVKERAIISNVFCTVSSTPTPFP